MTKVELKRKLVPGTELTLVKSLLGATSQKREIMAQRSYGYDLRTFTDAPNPNSISKLYIDSSDIIIDTDGGFDVVLKNDTTRVLTGYLFGFKGKGLGHLYRVPHGTV